MAVQRSVALSGWAVKCVLVKRVTDKRVILIPPRLSGEAGGFADAAMAAPRRHPHPSLRGTFKLPLIRNRRPQLAPVVCHRIPEAVLHLHLFSQEALRVFAAAEPSIPARKLVPDSHFQRKWLAQVSGLRDQGLEIRVWASELWVRGSGIKNQGSGIRTQGSGVVDRGSRVVTPQWLLYWLWRILCHNLIRLWWSASGTIPEGAWFATETEAWPWLAVVTICSWSSRYQEDRTRKRRAARFSQQWEQVIFLRILAYFHISLERLNFYSF